MAIPLKLSEHKAECLTTISRARIRFCKEISYPSGEGALAGRALTVV
jgi:hypothetical protein